MSLPSMRIGSKASPKRDLVLKGAAAKCHLVLMSACQWRNQRRRQEVMLDARAREANLAELRVASAEYSVAAISFLSWCSQESSGEALACICHSQIRDVLAKKDAAVADFIAHAATWWVLQVEISALLSSVRRPSAASNGRMLGEVRLAWDHLPQEVCGDLRALDPLYTAFCPGC